MIYSQSFFFSALREDYSKSNFRALRSRAEFHSYLPFASISYKKPFCSGTLTHHFEYFSKNI